MEDFAKLAEVLDRLDKKERLASDGSKRDVTWNTPGGKAELLLRSIDPQLREIIDKHTIWYDPQRTYSGKRRVFTLENIIKIAQEWKNT